MALGANIVSEWLHEQDTNGVKNTTLAPGSVVENCDFMSLEKKGNALLKLFALFLFNCSLRT